MRITTTTVRRIAVAIIATCLLQAHGNAASAGLADIAAGFPSLSNETVSLVLTSMMVSIVPSMVLAGMLVNRLGEKKLVLIGFVLTVVAGLGSFFIRSFPLLIAARILTGIGTGLVMPMQASLIPQHFTGYRAQRLFGLQSATISMLGIGYGLIGGFLAAIQWNYLFLVFLMGVPSVLLVWLWLPGQPTVEEEHRPRKDPFRVNGSLLYLSVVMFFLAILMFKFVTGIAFLMEEQEIATEGAAGYCVAIFNTGVFFSSLMYDRIQKKFGLWSIPFGTGLATIGLAAIGIVGWLDAPLSLFLITSMFAGTGLGTIMPALASRVTTLFRDSNTSLALATVLGSFFVGSMLSPYVTARAAWFPGGDNIAGEFVYSAAGLVLLLILMLLTWRRGTRDPATQSAG